MFCLIYKEKKYYILSDIIKDLDFYDMTLVKGDKPNNNTYNYGFKLTNICHEYYHCYEYKFSKDKNYLIKSIIDYYKNKHNIKMITIMKYKYLHDSSIYYPLSMIPIFLIDCVDYNNRLEITLLKYSWL